MTLFFLQENNAHWLHSILKQHNHCLLFDNRSNKHWLPFKNKSNIIISFSLILFQYTFVIFTKVY